MPRSREDHPTGNPRSTAKRTSRYYNGFYLQATAPATCHPSYAAHSSPRPASAASLSTVNLDRRLLLLLRKTRASPSRPATPLHGPWGPNLHRARADLYCARGRNASLEGAHGRRGRLRGHFRLHQGRRRGERGDADASMRLGSCGIAVNGCSGDIGWASAGMGGLFLLRVHRGSDHGCRVVTRLLPPDAHSGDGWLPWACLFTPTRRRAPRASLRRRCPSGCLHDRLPGSRLVRVSSFLGEGGGVEAGERRTGRRLPAAHAERKEGPKARSAPAGPPQGSLLFSHLDSGCGGSGTHCAPVPGIAGYRGARGINDQSARPSRQAR